jgi:hypothetical protein
VYHLSRLLLLYHDPQLCNHIDSLKLSFSDFRYNKPGHESVLWIRFVRSDQDVFPMVDPDPDPE